PRPRHWHLQLRVRLIHGLDQQTFARLARDDRGTGLASFDHRLASVDLKTAQLRGRMTCVAVLGQHRPDALFEKLFRILCARHGRTAPKEDMNLPEHHCYLPLTNEWLYYERILRGIQRWERLPNRYSESRVAWRDTICHP